MLETRLIIVAETAELQPTRAAPDDWHKAAMNLKMAFVPVAGEEPSIAVQQDSAATGDIEQGGNAVPQFLSSTTSAATPLEEAERSIHSAVTDQKPPPWFQADCCRIPVASSRRT
jgi:hypothetical protein